ncbi:MAG: hypothetical protein ABDH23_04535 [Endomicrobiia bacterium]
MKNIVCLSLLFLLLVPCGFTQIKSQTFLNKKKVFLGDFFEYNIVLLYPENFQIKSFDIYEVIKDTTGKENFILYKKESKKTKKFLSNKIKHKFVFYLIPVELGKLKLNELEISCVETSNNEEKIITLPSLEIEVLPYPKPKNKKFDGEIIDIKKQIWIRNYLWAILVLISIVLATLYFLYRYNKKQVVNMQTTNYFVDIKEQALKKLDELWNKNYINQNLIKEFYFELTEIVRWYVGEKYKVNALELTTEELFLVLKKKAEKNYNVKLKSFLENADLAKFAKHVPEKEQILKDFEMSKELIV